MSQVDLRVPDDWFVGFYTGLVARFWRAAGATMADRDAERVTALLELPPGASVIDVPCADGRIALRLAAAGYAVTGIEIAAGEVEHARALAAAAGLDATFLTGDLRDLPAVGPADALVSWGNSCGYLAHADTVRSLAGMHRLLRPGGRLVLESMTVAESITPWGRRGSSRSPRPDRPAAAGGQRSGGVQDALTAPPRGRCAAPMRASPTPAPRPLRPEAVAGHLDRLHPAARALCGSRPEAGDLVQDTCVQLLGRRREVRGADELPYGLTEEGA